ncbi:Hpt domain-containing protein, partial [Pseudomonas protegens]|uniref:Hpt domain-containing protein n=1 Tax=Pseudomonas protegens TaxID=380021 RepID=UPI0016203774
MSFGADEEILQDFLVEAGEILEQLSEQLVELESRPDDADLLNAIFRGFHTVKGGAGFLQLNELVECCHIAENVFDILRKGERRVDSELMDVVLEALDAVNGMFSQVRERTEITAATPELLAALARLAEPAGAEAPAPAVEEVAAPVAEPEAQGGDITDNEFELLLDSLNAAKADAEAAPAAAPVAAGEPASDEITDAEFESLLDQLHGKGQFAADAVAPAAANATAGAAAGGDEITDDEFEALLDQLHGKGTFAVDALDSAVAAAPAPAAAVPSAA